MTTKTKNHKDDRIDLRVKSSQKSFLLYAAELTKMKLSSFILSSAFKTAEEVVSDTVLFSLPKKQWNSFCTALDQPARSISKLKKLFSGKNVFDE